MVRKLKEQYYNKRCKGKGCQRIIRKFNKSGYCRYCHYRLWRQQKQQQQQQQKHEKKMKAKFINNPYLRHTWEMTLHYHSKSSKAEED